MCEKQNIQLYHIFENEWMFKKDIVKSIIKTHLNIYDLELNSSNCSIQEIDNITCEEFLKNNHIKYAINNTIRIGLYYNDNLVSVMTIREIKNLKHNYEILRYCDKLNIKVNGSLENMINYFITKYKPKSITTYIDRRYSNGKEYFNLNFIHIQNIKPLYYYFKDREYILYHSSLFNKEKLINDGYDPNKTESEIMKERKYMKIYDCGHMKFELKLV